MVHAVASSASDLLPSAKTVGGARVTIHGCPRASVAVIRFLGSRSNIRSTKSRASEETVTKEKVTKSH